MKVTFFDHANVCIDGVIYTTISTRLKVAAKIYNDCLSKKCRELHE
jgi:hypothetical protein